MKKLHIILALAIFCFCSVFMGYAGDGEIKETYYHDKEITIPFQPPVYLNKRTYDGNLSEFTDKMNIHYKVPSAKAEKPKANEKRKNSARWSELKIKSPKKIRKIKNILFVLLILSKGGRK